MLPFENVLLAIMNMLKTLSGLDPYTADVDYMIEKYKTVLKGTW